MAPARRAAALTAASYAALFFALGAHLPYWPVWLSDWGLSESDIGFYLGVAMLVRICGATLIPALADRWAIRRQLMLWTGVLSSAVSISHLWIATPGWLLAFTLLAALAMAPLLPLGEALGIRASGRFGFAYAPVRAAGSVAFLVANVAVGALIPKLGSDIIVWVVSVACLAIGLFGALHPGGGAPPGSDRNDARPGELLRLVVHPTFLVFALAISLGQASHAAYYIYSALDWTAQGISPGTIGWLWATGVLAETALMLGPGRRIVERISPAHAIAAAAAAGLVRWGAMSLAPPLGMLWIVQALHALTFAVGHLGAVAFIAQTIPHRLTASAQGAASGLAGGVAMAGASFAAAALVDHGDIRDAYLLMAAMSAIALLASLVLRRMWRGAKLLPSQP